MHLRGLEDSNPTLIHYHILMRCGIFLTIIQFILAKAWISITCQSLNIDILFVSHTYSINTKPFKMLCLLLRTRLMNSTNKKNPTSIIRLVNLEHLQQLCIYYLYICTIQQLSIYFFYIHSLFYLNIHFLLFYPI